MTPLLSALGMIAAGLVLVWTLLNGPEPTGRRRGR